MSGYVGAMLDDPDDLFMRFALLARNLKAETERRLLRYGVHAGQQFVLECLWEKDGLTPSEIADRIRVETPTATRALQRMEAAGLLRRTGDSDDARRVRIWLTPRSKSLRGKIAQTMADLQRDALALLSEAERRQFLSLIGRVLESVQEASGGNRNGPAVHDPRGASRSDH